MATETATHTEQADFVLKPRKLPVRKSKSLISQMMTRDYLLAYAPESATRLNIHTVTGQAFTERGAALQDKGKLAQVATIVQELQNSPLYREAADLWIDGYLTTGGRFLVLDVVEPSSPLTAFEYRRFWVQRLKEQKLPHLGALSVTSDSFIKAAMLDSERRIIALSRHEPYVSPKETTESFILSI